MAYNGWKMMDKIDVAVKTSPVNPRWPDRFDGYVVEHGDKKALESATSWAREQEWNSEKKEYDKVYEPNIHTFENEGFSVRILRSAQGSSQGGRLSFLACEVEKDGVKFVIGVNDALLVDLIRNSTIIKGQIQEKVMFVRKGGAPGFIHEGMEAYKEAEADKKQKQDLKSAKKTKKWEIGGVYATLTQSSVCIGKVWDTLEKYTEEERQSGYWYGTRHVTKFRKREKPVEVYAWIDIYRWQSQETPQTLEEFLKEEMKDRSYVSVSAGTPPARTKSKQLEVKESDSQIIDKILASKEEWEASYGQPKTKGRYKRVK